MSRIMLNVRIALPELRETRECRIAQHASVVEALDICLPDWKQRGVLACTVQGRARSLRSTLSCDSTVGLILDQSAQGRQIQRRSLCFIFGSILVSRFPASRPQIWHSLGDGFLFTLDDAHTAHEKLDELRDALADARGGAEKLEPFTLSWLQAREYFTSQQRSDVCELLSQLNEPEVEVYRFGTFYDLDLGVLVAQSDQLPDWDIQPHERGFVLAHPGEPEPDLLQPFRKHHLLYQVYREAKHWGERLKVSTVAQLNALSLRGKVVKDFIWTSEALHQQKIAELASSIALHADRLKAVLIAGPSSSGKTTFAKRLSIQLAVSGLRPVTFNLDDYFVNRKDTPLNPDGSYDFESIKALDVELINEHLRILLEGGSIELPSFDFKKGERVLSGRTLSLDSQSIIVMEGIHGLNEALTPVIPKEHKFHIYVSALTQLNIDRLNRIPTTDNRLLRRLVRDSRYRGHSAEATLGMWPSVRRGENKNIFPFQDRADAVFNSSLDFELGVLKPYVDPLLRAVSPDNPHYSEARRLLQFLSVFMPIPAEYVPENSILREFIGGSMFKY